MDLHADRHRWDGVIDLSNIYTQTASELVWLVTDEITWEQALKDSRQLKMKTWAGGSGVCCC